ncbi:hypothetical protein [Actinacidiphila glaucinigra]|uniref:hypothetical protein n=1 Tax=Actinacidiphila glaucinigra TaxID=235986 RepID=UPI0036728DF4
MNDLEIAAGRTLFPLIRGESLEVPESEAALLATWAVKTAMVRGRVDGDPYAVPAEHRSFLMQNVCPPSNTTVWVATCQPHSNAVVRHLRLYGELPATPLTEVDSDGEVWMTGVRENYSLGHATTIVINSLTLLVTEADSSDLADAIAVAPFSTVAGGALHRLWPDPQAFSWPFKRVLTPMLVGAISGLAGKAAGNGNTLSWIPDSW